MSLASFDERMVTMHAKMAAATHAYDVPLLAQMGHRGRRVSDAAAFLSRPMVAPSSVPAPDFSVPQLIPHEMSTDEVETVVEQFRGAAQRARRGDLDGIELAVGMDFLFANLLNPRANRREDRYGGETLEARMTFLDEVVEVVRDELGRERLLGVRLYDDLVEYGLTLDDYVEVAKLLEKGGKIDYFNMWQGIVPSLKSGRTHWPSYYYEPGHFAYLPATLKAAVSLPVVGAGRVDTPALADRLVDEGKTDIIGMARALIADPHFPNKAKAGRTEDIRPCIACTRAASATSTSGWG